MHLHRSHKTRIVRRLARYGVPGDESFPCGIYRGSLGQQNEQALDLSQLRRGLRGRQTQAVLLDRSGGHNPQLNKILGNYMKASALQRQEFKRSGYGFVLRVANL